MSLEYQEILINGYVNNTDKFGLLVGYDMGLYQPLQSGINYAYIVVTDLSGNIVDEVGVKVFDNDLTPTYAQLNGSSGNPKSLLVPPGYGLKVGSSNGVIFSYGMLLLGTLDEIARVGIR